MALDHPDPGPTVYVLWCAACRRGLPVTADDIARFVADGWPHCCDRKMMSYAPKDFPPKEACGCCDRHSLP